MIWTNLLIFMMLLLRKTFPYMIAEAMCNNIKMLSITIISVPSLLASFGGYLLFGDAMTEWWYVPATLMLGMTIIYAIDLYMAILLTGRAQDPPKAWEFRTDKFKLWIADLIGAYLLVGLFNLIPMVFLGVMGSAVERFELITPGRVQDGYNFLLISGVGMYIGVCLSGCISILTNAARAGVIEWKITYWLVDRFDSYKAIAPGVKIKVDQRDNP